jgi:hypothetical protein
MKKGLLFLAILAAVAISFVLLIRMGAQTGSYSFWIVLFLLPFAGYMVAKTDFRTDD